VLIIGAGESGVGAALLAQKLGASVFVSDSNTIKSPYREELVKNNIRFEEGGKDEWLFNVHVAIKSPGVPDHAPHVKSLTESGIPFFSEIEFGYHYYTGCLLAVTGSNGKTTTSGLLSHVLHRASRDVKLCGNVGTSLCRTLLDPHPDYLVVEVSSFQLDNVEAFRPKVSILLNISEDHLDRYQYNFDLYADAKIKIALAQESGDTFIYNADDEATLARLRQVSAEVKQVAISRPDYDDAVCRLDGAAFEYSLQGKHNRFNAAAVIAAARAVGLSDDEIAMGLADYRNFPHRLEAVAEIDGVTYINDSKATNVDAVYSALEGVEGPIVLIAGGVDKGNDYSMIDTVVTEKVKALVSLGTDNQPLNDWWMARYSDRPLLKVDSMTDAVVVAREVAQPGDCVLLSPACASFDLYRNYIHRGDQFKAAVSSLQSIAAEQVDFSLSKT
jgi:UDP-N-acetylmuramoylalanine--D-glutamate ligase